jgi:hypothetical protein
MAVSSVSTLNDADDLFDPDAKKPDGSEAFLDQPVNASNPKQLKAKALSDKQREFKQENDIRAVLSTEAGVRFVAGIISRCGWHEPFFHPNNSTMCEVAGRRSIAWQIEQQVKNTDLGLWFSVERELEQSRVKPKTSERR